MLKKALAPIVLLAVTAVALPAQDLTLDQVLERHYETIGGLEAWTSLESVKMTGRLGLGPGMEAPFTIWNARPRKSRMDFTFQGVSATQAYDGETGWMIMPFMGNPDPEEMPAEQAELMHEDADLDGPLIGWQEDGIQLELTGIEEVDGTPAYKIRITMPNGREQFYFLETDYYLPIRAEGTREMQGQEVQFVTIMGDYKEVGGLIMPHSIESRAAGMPQGQVITVDSVELNPAIEDDFFTMPAAGGN